MPTGSIDAQIADLRGFNRLYTQRIGILREGHLDSGFSLTEVRVLYEIAHGQQPTAAAIRRTLALDAGYLSRILRRFQARRLISRRPSDRDAREMLLGLSAAGRRLFAALDSRASAEIRGLLETLETGAREQLVVAVNKAGRSLRGESVVSPVTLREPRAGDLGWIVHRHGVLYAQEYGWDERFEALVAEIVWKFVRDFVPARERCWVAERDGEILGSVFLVQHSRTVGKLRLLYVEPSARGVGLGGRLVEECLGFARAVGYRRVMLWTNSVLHAARRIYERAGFELVEETPHEDFGPALVGQTWSVSLSAAADPRARAGAGSGPNRSGVLRQRSP